MAEACWNRKKTERKNDEEIEIAGSDPKEEIRHEKYPPRLDFRDASGTKKQFYRRAEPHIHIKP